MGERIEVLGTVIDVPPLAEAAARVTAMARARAAQAVVLHRDAHGVLWARKEPRVRAAERSAALVLPDGMPLVWLARAAGARRAERVYGPDLLEAVCALGTTAGRSLRHAFVGGGPGVADALARRLRARFPGLVVAGTLSPTVPDPTVPDPALAAAVDALDADVVWVGLGTPKQDLWMATHRPLLRAPVLIGCGAAFDFLAGTKPQAPRWMRRCGLEWLFRLASEPRRLGPRYLVTVPVFAALAFLWLVRCRARTSS